MLFSYKNETKNFVFKNFHFEYICGGHIVFLAFLRREANIRIEVRLKLALFLS